MSENQKVTFQTYTILHRKMYAELHKIQLRFNWK